MRHAIPRRTHSWTPDADKRLLEAVNIYGTDSWALGGWTRSPCITMLLTMMFKSHDGSQKTRPPLNARTATCALLIRPSGGVHGRRTKTSE